MSMLPLFEIIFYIATLFAPVNTTGIVVLREDKAVVSYTRVDEGWQRASDESMWKVEGLAVQHDGDSTDVSGYVKGAKTHAWSELSILTLSGHMEVLKVADGYWVYPSGIDTPKDKWVIKYIVEPEE